MMYKRWMTNCRADDAFEYLMKYSAEYPDRSFTIGRPHPTNFVPYELDDFGSIRSVTVIGSRRGFTTEELEDMDYRAIYECHDPN